jgi:hypothetical protein
MGQQQPSFSPPPQSYAPPPQSFSSSPPAGAGFMRLIRGWNPMRQPSLLIGVVAVVLIPSSFWWPVSPVLGILAVLSGLGGLLNGFNRGLLGRGFSPAIRFSAIGVGLGVLATVVGGAIYFFLNLGA